MLIFCTFSAVIYHYTLCLKKVPTLKLSVTLSNLNRFTKFLHCWKAYEICYETHTTYDMCGVRQGGVLSPLLFSVYVNDMI